MGVGRIIAVIVVLGALGGGAWLLHARRAAKPAAAPTVPVAVRVAAVAEGTVERWATVVGTLVARNDLTVAPEGVGGRIVELAVDVGDTVTAGQVVVRLAGEAAATQRAQAAAATLRAAAAVKQQEAVISELRAAHAEALAAVQRVEALGSGMASAESIDQKRTAGATAAARVTAAEQGLEVARAEVAQAAAQEREAALAVERTVLRAPAAGVVLARPGQLGAVVGSGQVLLQLAQDGEVEFAAEVTEDLLALVAPGQAVTLDAGGVGGTGTVRRVDPSLDAATRLGHVRVTLAKPDRALRPGLSARGRLRLASGSGTVVPTAALLDDGGGTVVMVVADGHARRRAVGGLLRAGERTLVGSGLVAGEQVVARAPNFVSDGEAVTPAVDAAPVGTAPVSGPASAPSAPASAPSASATAAGVR